MVKAHTGFVIRALASKLMLNVMSTIDAEHVKDFTDPNI